MSVKSSSSVGEPCGGTVVRAGYLKKLKTFKKKFFVLRAETAESSARLEYYDSEKKFNNGQTPKRSIQLKTCFNINRRVDTKHKHVIALYTKDDCFCVVLETEEELEAWLKALLSLQHGEEAADGETPRPTFEHIWQVKVLNRGLGGTSLIGANSKAQDSAVYRLCLTDKTLSLIRKDRETPQAELSLSSIRSCGSLKNFFYLEIGRSSVTGAGELWMETEDANIAQNVHQTVFHAMSSSNSSREELGPKSRNRSSSATESTKPVGRRQTTQGGATKPHYHTQGVQGGGRERCDSMPSRARTSSEGGNHPVHSWNLAQPRSFLAPHNRPPSLHSRDISHSPPAGSPVSPPSAACSTDSAGSSLSIDDSEQWQETDTVIGRYVHSLTPDEAIAEENCDDCPESPSLPQGTSPSGYVPMAPISSDDGYVDMSPRGRHANMSPAASTSSVTSGTPSTDMRFIEYPLEKVSAYFPPSEDDASSVDRPMRAYSVGSRPEAIRNKGRIDLATALDSARVRAFSVGSRSKKGHSRVLPPHGAHIHPKPKSSSAPLLISSRTLGSHSSDDLMEMDFSRPANSGYVDMNPAHKISAGYVEMRPGFHDMAYISETSPYVDMHPGSSPTKPSFMSPAVPMDYCPTTLPQQVVRGNAQEYVDMDPRSQIRNDRSGIRSQIHSIKPSTSPRLNSASPWHQPDYMDMNFQSRNTRSDRHTYSSSPKCPEGSPSSVDYMDMAYHPPRSEPKSNRMKTDGYVEMTIERQTGHQRHSSVDSTNVTPDSSEDYTNMSIGSGKRKEKPGNKKDKNRSQPITIQTSSSSQHPKNSSSISPVYSSLHVGRKFSTGTPPKMHLPLSSSGSGSYSSLPRQRPRKNSRKDSKDSSSSSVTTPSGSSTIFPFSPSSPMKPFSATKSPETSIKVPQAVMNVKYSPSPYDSRNEDYTMMDFDVSKAPPASSKHNSNDSDYVNYNPSSNKVLKITKREDTSGDYAIMRPGNLDVSRSTTAPPTKPPNVVSSPSTLSSKLSSMDLGLSSVVSLNMCFMPISESKEDSCLGTSSPRPGDLAPNRSIESLKSAENISIEDSDSLFETLHGGDCLSPIAKISRPNSVNSDKFCRSNSRPGSVTSEKSRPASVSSETARASLSRPSSASSELGSSSSTIVGSRPASVNSDKIRPSSVTIEGQLHYVSLDLAPPPEEEGNRSPRTVKTQTGNNEASASSPTQTLPEPGSTYAEIDFIKSEGFKHNPLPNNTKVKH